MKPKHIKLKDLVKESMHSTDVSCTPNKALDEDPLVEDEAKLLDLAEKEMKRGKLKKLKALKMKQGEKWCNYKAV